MNIFNSIIIILMTISSISFSQESNREKPNNNYEIKIGGELNRIVPSFGIAKNFYISNNVSLAPELFVIGAPILAGTFRISFPISDHFRISPEAGFGLTPVGFLFSGVGIVGLNVSYKIGDSFNIFMEPRIFYYPEKIISIGSGFWGIDELNKTNPFVLTFGIGF